MPLIDKERLKDYDYDIIIVIGKNASLVSILNEAEKFRIDTDKVVLDRTICVPGFTIERYKKLRNSQLSIFSLNCWGGFVYNRFGLSFLSPTINMFTSEKDMLKFLGNPTYYMDKELRFYKTNFEVNLKNYYPIFFLGDIQWDMNHYGDLGVDGARQKWEERRLRINWFNLLVMMYTENPKILAEFDKLPYAKKVCFVPFETDLDSGFYLEPQIIKGRALWETVNNSTSCGLMNYDLWDILLYGKKTSIKILK